jgi:elongation factor G
VYAGSITKGDTLRVGRERHRLAHLYQVHGDKREAIERAQWGEIVAVMGIDVPTGTTLSASGEIELEGIASAEPLVRVAVQSDDRDRLASALAAVCREDPSLRTFTDPESGQVILAGLGELHVEVTLERVRRDWGLQVRAGQPQVAWRATLARSVTVTARHIHQTGGNGQYAIITVEAEPVERGGGVSVVDATTGGAISREFARAAERGIIDACESSAFDGWPLTDVRFTITDGRTHQVDSSEMAFRAAGRLAAEMAQTEAGLVRLQPMARVDASVPEENVGPVVGELQRRGGQVTMIDGDAVQATVPLAACFGWVGALRSLTQGRGTSMIEPAGYEAA